MKGFDIGKVPFKENDKERNFRESFIPAVKDGLQWSGIANVQSPAPPQTIHVDLKISSEQTKYGTQRLFKVKFNCTVQNAVTNILFFLFLSLCYLHWSDLSHSYFPGKRPTGASSCSHLHIMRILIACMVIDKPTGGVFDWYCH